MNPFLNRYETYSNADLLRVLENEESYQVEAVEAAKDILAKRNLSDRELDEAKRVLEIEKDKELERLEERERVKTTAINYFYGAIDSIHPIQKSEIQAGRMVILISIVFGLIALYNWYTNLGFVQFALIHGASLYDITTIESLFIPLLLTIAVVQFCRIKKSGWFLLTFYLTYSTVGSLSLMILYGGFLSDWNSVHFIVLYPSTNPETYLFLSLFYGLTLWGITFKKMLEHFGVSRREAVVTIGLGAVASNAIILSFMIT